MYPFSLDGFSLEALVGILVFLVIVNTALLFPLLTEWEVITTAGRRAWAPYRFYWTWRLHGFRKAVSEDIHVGHEQIVRVLRDDPAGCVQSLDDWTDRTFKCCRRDRNSK